MPHENLRNGRLLRDSGHESLLLPSTHCKRRSARPSGRSRLLSLRLLRGGNQVTFEAKRSKTTSRSRSCCQSREGSSVASDWLCLTTAIKPVPFLRNEVQALGPWWPRTAWEGAFVRGLGNGPVSMPFWHLIPVPDIPRGGCREGGVFLPPTNGFPPAPGNSANTVAARSLSLSPARYAKRNASLGIHSRTLIPLGEIMHHD